MQSRYRDGDPTSPGHDHVDRVCAQWAGEVPDLDTTPLGVIARLGRIRAYIDHEMDVVFARYGLTRQSWDVLVSLRRVGEPHRLTPTQLYEALMRTSGAVTHTLQGLEHAGLIDRVPNPHDGRSLLVQLTADGRDLVQLVGPAHLRNQRRMLEPLTADELTTLADLLRPLLVAFERRSTTPEPIDARAVQHPDTRRRSGRSSPGRPGSADLGHDLV